LDGKPLEVANEEIFTTERNGSGNNVSREAGNVHDPADLSIRRDRVKFSVAWFNRTPDPTRSQHAVPGPIRFEIVGLGICYPGWPSGRH